MSDPKQQLQKIIDDLKTQKFRASEAKGLISAIQEEQTKQLKPVLENITKTLSQSVIVAINGAMKNIKIDAPKMEKIEIPKLDLSVIADSIKESFKSISFPTPRVDYRAPEIRIPEFKMPDEQNIKGWVSLMGYDRALLSNPLPVQLRDAQGKPLNLFDKMTQIVTGGNSGKSDFFTIKGFSSSAYSNMMNSDGRIRVSVETGGSGLTDSELRASSVPVEQVSGSNWSTYVTGMAQSSFAEVTNPDGRVKVELPTGSSGLTDTELRASTLDVRQVSGSSFSVNVSGFTSTVSVLLQTTDGINYDGSNPLPVTGPLTDVQMRASTIDVHQVSGWVDSVWVNGFSSTIGASLYNGDNVSIDPRGRVWVLAQIDEITQKQISGAVDSVVVNGFLTSIAASIIGSDGLAFGTTKPLPVTMVAGVSGTTGAANVDSSGVQYCGSNPMPVVIASGFASSTLVVGSVPEGTTDDGAYPLKTAGIVRTTNPAAHTDGQVSSISVDPLGRQLIRPVQIRGLIKTSYTTISNGTEATMLTAAAGTYLDMIYVMGSNSSDAAVQIDLRCVAAGNIVNTIWSPAQATAGFSLTVPYPQCDTGNAWTADMGDITGTTVTLSALFSQEL